MDFKREVIRVRANWSHGRLVTTKGDRVRSVPLVPQLAGRLHKLLQGVAPRGPDDPVFCDEVGQRLDGSALRRRFIMARERAGLRPLRLHDLRHTFASLAIDMASPAEVQAWAGHQDARTTARYTHYKSRRDEARRLAQAFGDAPGDYSRSMSSERQQRLVGIKRDCCDEVLRRRRLARIPPCSSTEPCARRASKRVRNEIQASAERRLGCGPGGRGFESPRSPS